jgi:hypothetical protein
MMLKYQRVFSRQFNLQRRSLSSFSDNDVVVASFARSPIGKLGGALASVTAPRLGSHCIEAAVERAGIEKKFIDEVIMGNVVSAGVGQAPGTVLSSNAHIIIIIIIIQISLLFHHIYSSSSGCLRWFTTYTINYYQ